jgi:hypothetical protein
MLYPPIWDRFVCSYVDLALFDAVQRFSALIWGPFIYIYVDLALFAAFQRRFMFYPGCVGAFVGAEYGDEGDVLPRLCVDGGRNCHGAQPPRGHTRET